MELPCIRVFISFPSGMKRDGQGKPAVVVQTGCGLFFLS